MLRDFQIAAMPKKKHAPQHHRKGSTCAICKGIPDYKFVETLHTNERLPEEVAQLLVIGGYGLYGSEQVRKCPTCGTYYAFLHDHDSESGVGYGYTDESIERLTPEKALVLIEKTLKNSRRAIEYWSKQGEAGTKRPGFLKKHQKEFKQLENEKQALLDILPPLK